MERAAPPGIEVPDTGSLRSDLIELLRQTVKGLGSVRGEVLAGSAAETARDPDAAALHAWIASSTRGDAAATVLARAAERHEIRAVNLPPRVLQLPFDLVRNEVVLHGRPPADDAIASIVDDILLPLIRQLTTARPGMSDEGWGHMGMLLEQRQLDPARVAERLPRLLDQAFLAEIGWDTDRTLLQPPSNHALLGRVGRSASCPAAWWTQRLMPSGARTSVTSAPGLT
ncbi:TetR-like C-terminal domain-containing protein [Nonomuraea sp. NPDC049684]|uniref:TetR-like C-terminal domain-containing protein n=1 Tax=Nonomuraea sp. NPDC049684 TaxID=3364356 RepID=UPI00378CB823